MKFTLQIYILMRMRSWRLVDEPEVFVDFEEAKKAFEEYTRTSYDELRWLADEQGANPDEILGGCFAGSSILVVEVTCPHGTRTAA